MHYPLLAVKRLSLPELAEAHRIPEQTDCPKIKHHLNICLVCIRFSNQSGGFFLSDGSDNLEYWNIDLRISSFQMESHRHARGEELGVLWHCQHLDLPSPQWHVMALDIIMSQQGWIQNAGEKSSDPTTLAMQRLQERCFTSTECVQGSLCCDGHVVVFWLPSSGLKQLSSVPLPAPHRVDVIPENCFWPSYLQQHRDIFKAQAAALPVSCLSLPQCIRTHHVLVTFLKWKTRVKWELCFSVHLSLEIRLLFLPYIFIFFSIS